MKKVAFTPDAATQAKLEAHGNQALQVIINSTPAQIDAWLLANVTNLAEARNAMKIIIMGLRYLLRKDVE